MFDDILPIQKPRQSLQDNVAIAVVSGLPGLSDRNQESGNGDKQRLVPLSPRLLESLRESDNCRGGGKFAYLSSDEN
ncbi:MAG: hypothetical protein R3C05_25975 [Pirellulaceae bacterium]